MNKGLSLIELMLSLSIASVLIFSVYTFTSVSAQVYSNKRQDWYCMQSIRNTIVNLDRDLAQCAYLLPQDMKIALGKNQLFIAGLPVTTKHAGLCLQKNNVPPFYSITQVASAKKIVVDTVDIDQNGVPDFWADLGIISDNGPAVISHNYSRGQASIPLRSTSALCAGDRVVPAIVYELKTGGLYRNSQLLAEAITSFDARIENDFLFIQIQAGYNGTQKEFCYPYAIN
ncbi:MAG: prepilin-type N-terminal cleavage/methylation domain-containing protein [Deltaproteobacteria bacterium]|nr:prepilin-type N-terminal cleavage/methylation domain-containing protein [Deltaproteobacteria bacterium]